MIRPATTSSDKLDSAQHASDGAVSDSLCCCHPLSCTLGDIGCSQQQLMKQLLTTKLTRSHPRPAKIGMKLQFLRDFWNWFDTIMAPGRKAQAVAIHLSDSTINILLNTAREGSKCYNHVRFAAIGRLLLFGQCPFCLMSSVLQTCAILREGVLALKFEDAPPISYSQRSCIWDVTDIFWSLTPVLRAIVVITQSSLVTKSSVALVRVTPFQHHCLWLVCAIGAV